MTEPVDADGNAIAVVGLAGKFPGAQDVGELWANLRAGVESVTFFSDEELAAAGVPEEIYSSQNYVRGRASLDGHDLFDAGFFEFSAREAELTDPQHRLFLECCWEALETAGYDPSRYPDRIGVYGGESPPTYLLSTLVRDPALGSTLLTNMQALYGNMSGFLATRVAYKLNLRGPAITVQTACSTSLVAVHLAAQSLLCGESEMALAGGVAVQVPDRIGYYYQDGGIFSADGHCRAFSEDAAGTVGGSGVGAVVLKRLSDALADGDHIWGVLRGTAVNNDGSVKVGYSAPSVSGQAAVIADAVAVSGVSPETIGYVEAHGTGTPLGDPIEVAALTEAWRAWTDATGYCALGSVKTNVGHLDGAAGVTGLIKALLATRAGVVPPSLNFSSANPKIDFASSPFFVSGEEMSWPLPRGPRRAAVSSFGLGGTNAHAVLEQPPRPEPSSPSSRRQVLIVSGRTWSAVDAASARLAGFLEQRPDVPLADVAHTLQNGRRTFDCRRGVVCWDHAEAVAALGGSASGWVVDRYQERTERSVVFLFPGTGAEYVGMGAQLYAEEPTFRAEIDRCADLLAAAGSDVDPRDVVCPGREGGHGTEHARGLLDRVDYGPPALFSVEYALARLLMSWGIHPSAMIGHSLGEYVAACLSGVLSLEDALRVVTARARLVAGIEPGAMIGVAATEERARELAGDDLDVAAVNAPSACVLAGPAETAGRLAERLDEAELKHWTVNARTGFHSALVAPILESFAAELGSVSLGEPTVPFVACPTGTWITAEQARDPSYWVQHLRSTVRFSDGLRTVLADPEAVLVEVGPGRTLSILAGQHVEGDVPVLSTMRRADGDEPDQAVLLRAVASLWACDVPVEWTALAGDERRVRVPLPTYPFERARYWLGEDTPEPSAGAASGAGAAGWRGAGPHTRPDLGYDFVEPSDELEKALAAIWGELLGFGTVGATDDFYGLGGHSLLATQLIARIRQTFPVTFSLDELMDNRTVADQAERVREKLTLALAEMSDEEVERQLSDADETSGSRS